MTDISPTFTKPFNDAVAAIQTRAERQDYEVAQILQEIFVDHGLLVQINTNKNQIVLGRRGSGKTHLLLALQNPVKGASGLFLYVDLRTIGSGINEGEPPSVLGRKYFSSFLSRLTEKAMEEVLRLESPTLQKKKAAEDAWGEFTETAGAAEFRPAVFARSFEKFLFAMGYQSCCIVLDEWVVIPRVAQPYFAEMLKKTFIASRIISLKIAAIDFQSSFSVLSEEGTLQGFDIGADVFSDVEMDTILIYDKEKHSVCRFFGKMLFNHLNAELKLPKVLDSDKLNYITQLCFTQDNSFMELVRACEGVPRDFLHIFVLAYFKTQMGEVSPGAKINIKTIRKAALEWFNNDKQKNIREQTEPSKLLHTIIDEVIGKNKARTFMVSQSLARHPLLLRLFDYRLIHILRRGWSHKDKPGERYDIFSIDYGAYVDLINTERAPQLELSELDKVKKDAGDIVVPFDDFRSIRRIELTKTHLDSVHDARKN